MSKVIVTGATEEFGRLVVQHLLKKVPASKIIVSVQNIEKASIFAKQGIKVCYIDYDDITSLERTFTGASKLLLISPPHSDSVVRIRRNINTIEVAKRVGVKHVLYTSFHAIDKDTFHPFKEVHLATEYTLRSSGLLTTILRNTWYQEAFVNESLQSFVDSGVIITSAGKGKINTVERNELALAAATVLAEDGHANKVYELASSETWNFDDLAIILSNITGKIVTHTPVFEAKALTTMIKIGVPAGLALFLSTLYNSMAIGNEENTSSDLEKLIGRRPTSIRESVTHFFNK